MSWRMSRRFSSSSRALPRSVKAHRVRGKKVSLVGGFTPCGERGAGPPFVRLLHEVQELLVLLGGAEGSEFLGAF